MKIKVDRKWPKATYTIGRLSVDGEYFCNTLEDRDRGLKQTDSPGTIKIRKVYGETAIPKGTYRVAMETVSPKYAAIDWYKKLNSGRMPRLVNVPGFEGILIHPGNTALDTYGCILVGKNTKAGQLTDSRSTFAELYKRMKAAHDRGERIYIEIV